MAQLDNCIKVLNGSLLSIEQSVVSLWGYSRYLQSRFYPLFPSSCHGSPARSRNYRYILLLSSPDTPWMSHTLSLQKLFILILSSTKLSPSTPLHEFRCPASFNDMHPACCLHTSLWEHMWTWFFFFYPYLSLTFIFLFCISAQSVHDYSTLQDS